MSLLTIVETKDIISVISDGQGTNTEGNVALTGFKKFYVSDSFFVGITGSHSVAKGLIESFTENQESDIKFVKHLLTNFKNLTSIQETPKKLECNIILCDHQFKEPICTLYTHFNQEHTIKEFKLNNSLPIIMHSDYLDHDIAHFTRKKLDRMVTINLSNEEIIQEQKAFHKLVASMDRTVNDEIFHHIVHKQEIIE
ncbi:hypothetical protein COM55_07695 [Bacillus pseudomycoides]|uniref:hypothetical protein n=1 Tax=Bacillus pseudomycoides TaxID=64104 RepID=UPI000BF2D785|nr:hypothetical protein [Bacillus pseudomycoides]PGE86634.1 hypothetical protein COM55_07695 [Bacillus pseudomycoides]